MIKISKNELLKILNIIQDEKKTCHYKLGYIENKVENLLDFSTKIEEENVNYGQNQKDKK